MVIKVRLIYIARHGCSGKVKTILQGGREKHMRSGQLRLVDLIDDMCEGKDVFFRLVRLVKDIMVEDVKTLTLDDSVETCLKFMKDNEVRHVPVIDVAPESERSYLVGVISERDLLRQISPYVGKIGEEETDRKALQQKLGQIVTRDPKCVSRETPIPDMIKLMLDSRIDMVPVLDDGELVGIVTASDIIKLFVRLDAIRQLYVKSGTVGRNRRLVDLLAGGSDEVALALSSVLRRVEDIMTERVVWLQEQDQLGKAIEVMRKGRFRHLPIVNGQKKLVGIVSDRDILHYLPMRRSQRRVRTEVFRWRLFDVDLQDPSLRLPLKRIMKRNVAYVFASSSFYEAVKQLHERKISCLVVVDQDKEIRGIITVTDVMRGLLAAYALSAKYKD